ncbi:MAG: DUF1667 domain-containing protein [Deltaproteobacteria bacterium]|nr:DUF1667 domain-containing protein [Deltaproteobacteria bacterium]
MPETTTITCINCPVGCPLQLLHEGDELIEVEGFDCKRGKKYGRQEFVDPRRTFSTTIWIEGARWARVPVKLTAPVPKDRIMEAARAVHTLRVRAPVQMGDVLLRDLIGEEGVDVVITRSMDRLQAEP